MHSDRSTDNHNTDHSRAAAIARMAREAARAREGRDILTARLAKRGVKRQRSDLERQSRAIWGSELAARYGERAPVDALMPRLAADPAFAHLDEQACPLPVEPWPPRVRVRKGRRSKPA